MVVLQEKQVARDQLRFAEALGVRVKRIERSFYDPGPTLLLQFKTDNAASEVGKCPTNHGHHRLQNHTRRNFRHAKRHGARTKKRRTFS